VTAFLFAYRSWLRPLFTVLGAGPGRSEVTVDGEALRVRLGPLFTCTVPLSAIERAEPSRTSWLAVGAHTNLRGTWVINADVGPAVDVVLDRPVRGRTLRLPVANVRRLLLGVAEPERLLDHLHRTRR
jgi:hypothetical protein